ncbi:hypothetical protein PsorP6_003705 [Peronosclerospora sorghi]|uniref:Uncharacterized protein n=1 Tax=Peronosclerospora sorghi TaxID=230839 RepID=A0ACC0VK60_9STRA|nr:hypothetical protein PsorP6_003705 [Peronosclerospora sorghi]
MRRPLANVPTTTGQLDEGEVLRAQRGESILQVFHPNVTICNVQVCRSVSMWSAGVPTEASIQAAYMDLISKSKHFLYIENQFFVSGMDGNGIVRNRILQALVDRNERAVQRDESANINDRSMNGDRGSDIALVIEDMQYEYGMMNEKPYRRGLSDDDTSIADPTSDHTWPYIKSTASNNTKIFEAVLDCAPSNRMRAFVNFQSIEMTQIFENQRMNVLKVPGRSHLWDANNLNEGDYAPSTM